MRLFRRLWCRVVGHNWVAVWRRVPILESESDFEIAKTGRGVKPIQTMVLEQVQCTRCWVRDIERERSIRAYLRWRWENPPEINSGEKEVRSSGWDSQAIAENYHEKRRRHGRHPRKHEQ